MIAISADHNTLRLAGTLTFMDQGGGNAGIAIYAGPRPEAGAAAADPPLVTIALAKPAGVLTDVLTLSPATPEGEMIAVSGTAAWARFYNGAGAWVMDADCGPEGSSAEVKLPSLTLYAGGRCPLSPSTIG